MAGQRISSLPPAGNLLPTDAFVIARGGSTYRIDGAIFAQASPVESSLNVLTSAVNQRAFATTVTALGTNVQTLSTFTTGALAGLGSNIDTSFNTLRTAIQSVSSNQEPRIVAADAKAVAADDRITIEKAYSANTYAYQSSVSANYIPKPAASHGEYLAWNSVQNKWLATPLPTVNIPDSIPVPTQGLVDGYYLQRINGSWQGAQLPSYIPVPTTAPVEGNILKWNGSSWAPADALPGNTYNSTVTYNTLDICPVGTLVLYPKPFTSPPTGYLPCNGAAYSPGDKPELFNVIQYTYGRGTPSSFFKVPGLNSIGSARYFIKYTQLLSNITTLAESFSNYIPKPSGSIAYGTFLMYDGTGWVASTTGNLQSTLQNYATTSSLQNYVTNSSLNSTLGSYATTASVNNTLGSYATTASVNNTLGSYATTTSLNNAVASLNNSLNLKANASALNAYSTSSQIANAYVSKPSSAFSGAYLRYDGTNWVASKATNSTASSVNNTINLVDFSSGKTEAVWTGIEPNATKITLALSNATFNTHQYPGSERDFLYFQLKLGTSSGYEHVVNHIVDGFVAQSVVSAGGYNAYRTTTNILAGTVDNTGRSVFIPALINKQLMSNNYLFGGANNFEGYTKTDAIITLIKVSETTWVLSCTGRCGLTGFQASGTITLTGGSATSLKLIAPVASYHPATRYFTGGTAKVYVDYA